MGVKSNTRLCSLVLQLVHIGDLSILPVYMCVVCVCSHVCVEARHCCQVSSSIALHPLLRQGLSLELSTSLANLASQLILTNPVFSFCVLRLQVGHPSGLAFMQVVGIGPASSHCTASALPMELVSLSLHRLRFSRQLWVLRCLCSLWRCIL